MQKTILIADDESYILRLLEATFRKGNYRLILVRSGLEALATLENEHPDLIILDVMMPDLDGLSALRQLKANEKTAGIPVIVLSAKGHTLTKIQAEEAGAELFLTKPFSPSQLLADVSAIFDRLSP